MKQLVWVIMMCCLSSWGWAQNAPRQNQKIPVQLQVGGHESLKAELNSYFKRELRSLGDVQVVEQNAALQIKVDGMETNVQKNAIRFVVSIILIDQNGKFLANDLGTGESSNELRNIAQKIISQVDSIYLDPLRRANIATRKRSPAPFQKRVEPTFPSAGPHWIFDKMEDGRFIKLEDNSLWEISPYDRSNSQLWLPSEEIFIIETDDEDYPYRLLNKNNEDNASARLISY